MNRRVEPTRAVETSARHSHSGTSRGALSALACLVFSLLVGPRAGAQDDRTSPLARRQQQRTALAVRLARQPEAILPLLQLWGEADHVSAATTRRELSRILRTRGLHPAVRNYADVLQAATERFEGRVAAAAQRYADGGFVTDWSVIGPFDNEGKRGFETAYGPEQGRVEQRQLGTSYPGRERPVSWRAHPATITDGYVDFDAVMYPRHNVCGYAESYVRMERARPLAIWLGSGGATKLWWNGAEVIADERYRGVDVDRFVAPVLARRGWNRVLIKSCVADQVWGAYLRLTDLSGHPFGPIEAEPMRNEGVSPVSGTPPRLPFEAPLAHLERRARENPDDAAAQYDLARFWSATSSADYDVQSPGEVAGRACELRPAVAPCLLASELASSRAEQMKWVGEARRVAPNDEDALIAEAGLRLDGHEPERAMDSIARIQPHAANSIAATLYRASLYISSGFPRAGLAAIEEVERQQPYSTPVVGLLVTLYGELGEHDRAHAHRERLIALRFNDIDTRRALLTDAMERADLREVDRHLAALESVDPSSHNVLSYLAGAYEGLGRTDEALAAYRRRERLAPDDPEPHVALARALLRFSQPDAAAAELRTALRLRPQDAVSRQLLEQIQPSERPDEVLATSTDEILLRRRRPAGHPATVLHDLRVVSAFDNGLSSTFRQLAVQVHDDVGARRWARYAVPYSPSSQWLQIRAARVIRANGEATNEYRTSSRSLSNPRYRIYYDQQATTVHFPDLEPGDVIELRYRVDDVAPRNAFGDYFGDLHTFHGVLPAARQEYVLRAPASRRLHFRAPELAGFEHTTERLDDIVQHRFTLDSSAASAREPLMPGATEIVPYVHVSTYGSWEEVGRWWWGLVRDQLHLDDELRTTAQNLVDGATTAREKVERIFHWVIQNTRYVGMEFGIHGYRPYRVRSVAERGFGDCKDKASLLYAMLLEVGVDARIALVRTRRNGGIDDAPASLAVFDHAIAYVPGLDLYLDGTVENGGTLELPAQDQGAVALVVGPSEARLTEIPRLPASRNSSVRTLDVALNRDGSAVVTAAETVTGQHAASFRSRYEAAGTREERLQSRLSGEFAGVELLAQDFDEVEALERPVHFTWRGRVPNFADRGGQQLRLRARPTSNLTRSLALRPTREHDLELGPPSRSIERRSIHLPNGAVAHLPAAQRVESPYGLLTVQYTRERGAIVIESLLEFRRPIIPREDYAAFRQWLGRVDRALETDTRIEVSP